MCGNAGKKSVQLFPAFFRHTFGLTHILHMSADESLELVRSNKCKKSGCVLALGAFLCVPIEYSND
jgi:hypothetical protein